MSKRIDPELKARAVRLVPEHQQEYPSQTAAIAAVARQMGLAVATLAGAVGGCVSEVEATMCA